MLEIDGSQGEGGGQLVRQAAALSALTGTPIRMVRARANRQPPGLAAQHLAAVRLVAALCEARTPGLSLRTQQFDFIPSAIRAGSFKLDVGTAGSIPLVLQAAVPVALAAPGVVEIEVGGGTDVYGAPAFDYATLVWQPLLARLGVEVEFAATCRGYYPRGGGMVRATIRPGAPCSLVLPERGAVREISGSAHTANLPAHIVARMIDQTVSRLERFGPVRLESRLLGPDQAVGTGGAIAIRAECGAALLGASSVARRGVPAEAVADQAATALAADLDAGATLDVHASDQLLLYLARADRPSEYLVRRLTRHASTLLWLLRQFLPLRWECEPLPSGVCRMRIFPS